ncbi:MAG: hypothetical protein B6229_00625 [Spirochaetaceae bacterium 4572_7]|nr:MAG: hypothetical protein B6229_00625 [Spirochaetaceae bacterium 4572_7]
MINGVISRAIQEYNQGHFSQALTTLLVSDFKDDDYIVNYYLGLCYISLKDFDNGKFYLEQFLERDDNLLRIFQTRMLLAFSSIQIEDFKEALLHLEKLLDSGYESARLYSLLGFVYYRKKNINKSIEYYQKALQLDSDNANALNALGFIFAENERDLLEAEKMCRKALSVNADNPAYLDSIGLVCLKTSKISASFSFFNRAIKLLPHNQEIEDHMRELKELRSMG